MQIVYKYSPISGRLDAIFIDNNDQYTSGVGAPTNTPSAIGAEYLDTDAGVWYKSIGTSSVDDRVVL